LKIRIGPSGTRETYTADHRSPSPRRVVEMYSPRHQSPRHPSPSPHRQSAGASHHSRSPPRHSDRGSEKGHTSPDFASLERELGWVGPKTNLGNKPQKPSPAAPGPASSSQSFMTSRAGGMGAGSGGGLGGNTSLFAPSLEIPGLDLLLKATAGKEPSPPAGGGIKLWPSTQASSQGLRTASDQDKPGAGAWWRDDSKSSPLFDKSGTASKGFFCFKLFLC
jgi:hypothetical protein